MLMGEKEGRSVVFNIEFLIPRVAEFPRPIVEGIPDVHLLILGKIVGVQKTIGKAFCFAVFPKPSHVFG